MDPLLKPDELKTLPEDLGAAKVRLHEYWFKTFKSVSLAVTRIAEIENEEAVNQLGLLTNLVTSNIHLHK